MTKTKEEEKANTKDESLSDLLIPAIPAMLSSLLLEGLADLRGLQKIGAGAVVGLILWGMLRHRSGVPVRIPKPSRQRWAVSLAALAALSVVALVVTVVAFDRPTPTTAAVTLMVLAALEAAALTGRRLPGAAVAGVTGGLVGLCLGIAVL